MENAQVLAEISMVALGVAVNAGSNEDLYVHYDHSTIVMIHVTWDGKKGTLKVGQNIAGRPTGVYAEVWHAFVAQKRLLISK